LFSVVSTLLLSNYFALLIKINEVIKDLAKQK
jgi:hypothetical protein